VANDPKHLPVRPALRELAGSAETKARDLIRSAELYLDMDRCPLDLERWPRAFALAVRAHKEFDECLMAMALLMAPPEMVQPARVRESQGNHVSKLMSACEHGAQAGSPGLRAALRQSGEITRDLNELRQRGFYAGLDDDGWLKQPSQISEDEARALVARVHTMIHAPGLPRVPAWLC
jgi:AbiV family abortive infection protein